MKCTDRQRRERSEGRPWAEEINRSVHSRSPTAVEAWADGKTATAPEPRGTLGIGRRPAGYAGEASSASDTQAPIP